MNYARKFAKNKNKKRLYKEFILTRQLDKLKYYKKYRKKLNSEIKRLKQNTIGNYNTVQRVSARICCGDR